MREIKYRAWDKHRKEYLSGGNVFIGIDSGARPLNSAIYLDLIDNPDVYKERFVLEQYTGLRDKNDIEIYEGDIFTIGDIKHTVEWHDTGLMGKQTGTFGSYVGLKHWSDRIEVIGNIHDNSNLLNPQN